MNAIKRHCPYCNETHTVTPTYDNVGNIVGYFCHREKLLVEVTNNNAVWNGEHIGKEIDEFTYEFIDKEALKRLKPDRLSALAKRVAYAFLQTDFAKERRINFAFVHYYALKSARGLFYAVQAEGGR